MSNSPNNSVLAGTTAPPLSAAVPDPSNAQPQAPAPNPQQPPAPAQSPWKNIFQGALWGLSGVSQERGRGGFGEGLAQGAGGAVRGQQQALQNQVTQKQLQMTSVQAADSHIRAMAEANLVDAQTEEARLNIQQQKINIDALNKFYGIQPSGTIQADNPKDMNAAATGALQTVAAASPDGKIPQVATANSPAGGSQKDHIIDYYAPPTAQQLQANPNGFHDLVAEAYKADGKVLTDDEWRTGGGTVQPGATPSAIGMLAQQQKGQQQMVMNAYQRLYSPFGGKEIAGGNSSDEIQSKNVGTAASLHQQADAYAKQQGANPTIAKILQGQADNFDAAVENARSKTAKDEQKQAGDVATSEEKAKKPFVEDERNFQTNLARQTAEINRQGADQNARKLKSDEMLTTESNNRDADLSSIEGVRKQLNLASNGNQQAYADAVTRFAEHEVKAGGINRFNETELKSIGTNAGSWGRQLDAYASKGFTGKGAAPTIAEMHSILNLETQQRNDLYNAHAKNIRENIMGSGGAGAAQPIYAASPGKPRLMSSDGGKTWQPAQ